MNQIWVLGNGQLGDMLQQAGAAMNVVVTPFGFDDHPPLLPDNAIISAEIEQWPNTALTRQFSQHVGFINHDTFPLLADRFTQKQRIDQLKLATSPWCALNCATQWPDIIAQLGEKLIVKRRKGGYDGRGQWRVMQADDQCNIPDDMYGECIVEQMIPFDSEVSLVGARGRDGTQVFYPLTHNLHENGILRASVALSTPNVALQHQAEQMLGSLMESLEYVGVMAMECFVVGNQLLINELAPRVHNSGHWTQAGASISQFELHLRALLGWPLHTPVVPSPAVMVNIIGTPLNEEWLSVPLARLHWYGKSVREGRKLGHINMTHPNAFALNTALSHLFVLLPVEYRSGIHWAQKILS
ncbi:MAG: 5-(carboxyamino)imidazole ribonucleotide synthase [Plesiomonas sp.]|uniref:5-(carboxyamino)imidazole ribonucleotide synthase n=1 Tax=Plesiomonas sp. TaxID=2486279 RepID=UPI003F407DDD